MTLAAHGGLDWLSGFDRRGVAHEPRLSWASPQPFVRRTTPMNLAAAREPLWRRTARQYRRRVLALDLAATLVVGAMLLATVEGLHTQVVLMAAVGATAMVALIAAARGYDVHELGDGPGEYQAVLRAGLGGAVLLMSASYLIGLEIPRQLVLVGAPSLILIAVLGRYLSRRVLHRARSHGEAMMRTLVVGEPQDSARIVEDLAAAPYHGYQVTAACVPSLAGPDLEIGVPVVGAVADVPQIVVDHAIDVVVVAGSHLSGDGLRRLSWALDRAGVQLILAPGIVEVTTPRLSVRPTAGLSLLEVEVGAPRRRMLAKSVLDRCLGMALLLAVTPLVGAAALAVRLTSAGPAFYRQTRVGVDGRPFTMWKLRSMYVDADARRDALLARSDGDGVLFKMRHDPRITPVGRMLRRLSIDELPQLLNVVKGDMSLVGPRPPLVEEVAAYADQVHRRLRVKPGLTGLWQVSGRSDLSWEESVRLDLRYVDNWSVVMDLMILWKTGRAVLGGHGAY